MVVRRLRADEVGQLRELRLAALAGCPEAFDEDYAHVAAQPLEFWWERAANGAQGDTVATFVAVAGARHVATATGVVPQPDETAELVSMWVEPDRRRQGIAIALIDAVCAWASEHGAVRIELCVHDGNDAARLLYERAGFETVGESLPCPRHDGVTERHMVRPLRTGALPIA